MQRVYVGRDSEPFGLAMLALGFVIAVVVLLALLVGALLFWIPIVVIVVAATIFAGALRSRWRRWSGREIEAAIPAADPSETSELTSGLIERFQSRRGARMAIVKYRMHNEKLALRRTRMEIPGWSGERQPRADGSREQVWHCVPFSESAQYGIELFYPYANELRVTTKAGKLSLDGDFGPAPEAG